MTPHDGRGRVRGRGLARRLVRLLAATNEGRDTFAISRYTLGGGWEVVHESEWDLDCVGDDAGRHLLVVANEDGYSRVDGLPLPGDGVAEHFVFSPDGRASRSVLDDDGAASGLGARLRVGRVDAS